jgi:hypothetical protein
MNQEITSYRKKSGRHSGKTILIKKGRHPIPMIDRIATQAWFNALINASHSKSIYQVALKFNKSPESKSFEKYARGAIRPTAGKLEDIDRELYKTYKVKVRMVFDDGPEGVPLWDAIAGDFEVLWDIIYKASPGLATLKTMRVSHEHRVHQFIDTLFSEPIASLDSFNGCLDELRYGPLDPDVIEIYDKIQQFRQDYYKNLRDLEHERRSAVVKDIKVKANGSNEMELLLQDEERRQKRFDKELIRHDAVMTGSQVHGVAINAEWRRYFNTQLHRNGEINFSIAQLAATIALWRISVLVSDGASRIDYLMTALIDGVIAKMLQPYGVEEKVIEILKAMQATYHRSLYP